MKYQTNFKFQKKIKTEQFYSGSVDQHRKDVNQNAANDNESDQSDHTHHLESTTVPTSVNDVLNTEGDPLSINTRSLMESRFGNDFSHVKVHTNAKAAESAAAVNARAYTVGNHIAFNSNEYKPGTLYGDTLIAHELAHVIQQNSNGSDIKKESTPKVQDNRLEEDANRSIPHIVASILGGAKTVSGSIAQGVMPGLKSGLRLQRCSRAPSIQAPSFLGTESKKTLKLINRIMENGGALQQWIAFGQVIATAENPISALHTAEAAEAIAAVPVIVRGSVTQQIEILLITHGNELNQEERLFWEGLLERL